MSKLVSRISKWNDAVLVLITDPNVLFRSALNVHTYLQPKGQLISKANCQAVNSSKKRTNEFVFTTMRRVFVRFLVEIEVNKKTFRN